MRPAPGEWIIIFISGNVYKVQRVQESSLVHSMKGRKFIPLIVWDGATRYALDHLHYSERKAYYRRVGVSE